MGVQPILPLRPVYTYRLRVRRRLRQIYIESMVIVRIGSVPILSIKWSVSIITMLNFDRSGDEDGTCKRALKVSITIGIMLHFDGHGDRDVTCNQSLSRHVWIHYKNCF